MRTNLLIFDKDAEIARCCADSTVLISVSTQRCRSPCLLNGADLRVYSTVPTQRCRSPCLLNGADLRVYSTVPTQRCRSPCLLNGADLRVYSTVPISVSTQRVPTLGVRCPCRGVAADRSVHRSEDRPRDIALKIGPDRPRSAEIGRDGQRSAEIGRDRHSTVDLCVDVALSMCRLSPEMQAIGR